MSRPALLFCYTYMKRLSKVKVIVELYIKPLLKYDSLTVFCKPVI